MISLRFKSGPNRGVRVDFDKCRIVFGRSPEDVDVVVDDAGVANVHGELTRIGRRFLFGRVGYAATARTTYAVGDHFVVGDTTFEIVGRAWDKAGERSFPAGEAERGPRSAPAGGGDERATQVDIRIPRPRRMADTAVRLVPSDCVVIDDLEAEGDPTAVLGEHEGKGRLIFLTGPHKDRRVFLGKRRAVMGRSEDAHIPIFDERLEAYHAAIHVKEDQHYLRRLSNAPVLLNGEPVEDSRAFGEGDIITVGVNEIEFQSRIVDLDASDGMATIAIPMPRFVLAGQVRMQKKLLIGRDPAADLFVEDRRMERRHAEIYFSRAEFRLKDLSASGARINGRPAVDERLEDGDSIQLGACELRVSIQAHRCGVEVVPREPGPGMRWTVAGGAPGAALESMYRMPFVSSDARAVRPREGQKKERKKSLAPVLRGRLDDVKRKFRHPLVVVIGILATLAATYLAFA